MKDGPKLSDNFNAVAGRGEQERVQLIHQLPERDQQRVVELRQQFERDYFERRILQAANRPVDIFEERRRLLLEHPQPVLRPDGHHGRAAVDLDRLAVKHVDERNRQEIATMAITRDQSIDRILHEKGLRYEQFRAEREQVQQQKEVTRSINNTTREI